MQGSNFLRSAYIALIFAVILSAAALFIVALRVGGSANPAPPVSSTPVPVGTDTPPVSTSCADNEQLVAPFDEGQYAVRTKQSYSGQVLITVSGYGQASGAEYTDAFYTFTDGEGNEVFPYVYGFYLMINGKRADELIPGGQVPRYSADHVYSFSIEAPGGVLSFGVDDTYTPDNSGSYQVTVCKQ
jgi:hypothetical protein